MKQTRLILALAVVAIISAMFFAITGCESDGDTGSGLDAYFAANPFISDPRTTGDLSNGGLSLSSSPDPALVTTAGQKVIWTVSGGDTPFTWAVASTTPGSIAAQTGNTRQAVYTVATVTKNNVIVSDANGYAAIGEITTGTTPGVQITPASWDVTASPTTFTASGGVPPYVWDTVSHTVGTVTGSGTQNQTGSYATANFSGTNSIVVTDSLGNSATANVY